MKLCVYEIEYEKLRDMTTEVLYKVASARARGHNVIRFDIKHGEKEKTSGRSVGYLARILRGMKKRSAIQFFVMKDAFSRSATEAQYLVNVFPDITENIPKDEDAEYIFVMI